MAPPPPPAAPSNLPPFTLSHSTLPLPLPPYPSPPSLSTPPPPYTLVLFSSTRHASASSTNYSRTARLMETLASRSPGFLGMEGHSTTLEDGRVESLFVSYWKDGESVQAWRDDLRHVEARGRGREGWYESWRVRVGWVEREVSFLFL